MKAKKALVVDNDQVLLTLLTNHLQKHGYEVAAARDGLSALETMNSFIPDVVFADYIMPNINGEKLCRIIRGNPHFDGCFLVMISAAAAEEMASIAETRAADLVLAKHNFDSLSLHIDGILQKLEEGQSDKLKGKTIAADELYEREVTKELLELQRHHEMTLNNMSEGLLEVTGDLKIIYANPAAVSIINIEEEKLLSTEFYKLFDQEDQKGIQAQCEKAYGIGQEIVIDKPVNLNGKAVAVKTIPVISEARSSMLIILKDLTRQKQLEAQLRHSQKIEALGTLTSGVAHDFNNILNIIMGYTELIETEVPEKHLPLTSLSQVKKASSRAKDIIRQLLLFTRKEDGDEKAPREIGLSIKEALKMMRSTTPAFIEIRESIPTDLPLVEIDISEIHQVIVNLCKNAVDAIPESGGTLWVSLEHVVFSGQEVCFDLNLSGGEFLKLTVSDTGHGISQADKERIFDPYFTTKAQDKGTGLGLSVVLGIVEGLGGGVRIESEVGSGTTFEVYLPVSDNTRERQEAENNEEIPEGSESLLFVDDEESAVSLNRSRLQRLGYSVECETDPEKALERFLAAPDQFDLIITDITMPKMSGTLLSREIHKARPDMKIIACTGYNKEMAVESSHENAFAKYLEKPVDTQTMAVAVRLVLDQQIDNG